ncbi:MAG TPA: LacI family DNA-binding transcriptional regulator [Acidobacteriaceae bacterium]|nr:LacI family DNA-binding transcriptional regulator [Acidobacteriaceae bacterium]
MNIMAVARRARVSTATVSRVINGTAFVAPETAERVRDAIEALNFYPDVNARTLGSGRSGMYGLIISDITNPYFPELVKAFEDIAVEHNQEVLIANTNYDPKRMETCVARMLQRKVDGVAIMTSEMGDHLVRSLSRRHIPMVFMDTSIGASGTSTVRVNYKAGVQAAMEHLFALGHKDIAFISGPLSLGSAYLRAQAFRQALEQHGMTGNAAWIQEGDHRVEGGHGAMQRILKVGRRRPTAVLTSNDLTAIGAMGAIHEAGLRIPEDISIVGFDGIELSAYTQPALTTLVVSRVELASQAFRSLLRSKDDVPKKSQAKDSVIEPRLLVRKSTAPPRKA